MYGGQGFQTLPGLEITATGDRVGYLVEDAVRDYLGGGRSPFSAELDASFREIPLGLSAAGRAQRFRADMRVDYRLTGPDGFEITGRVIEPVFYDAPTDPYAQIAARSAAEERAAERVAEQLVREFAVALERAEAGLEP
jgi:LPS-assembly lipoprotein